MITVSDRCAAGLAEDKSGPLAVELLTEAGHTVLAHMLSADGIQAVSAALTQALAEGPNIIFTCGGTGITPRDLTPEATEPFLAVQIPGIADAIRRAGEAVTPMAALSRGLVGITSRAPEATLIVNTPGSPSGVKDALAVLLPVLPHIVSQIAGGDHERA